LSDVDKCYKTNHVDFEASWFPVFYFVNIHREVTIRTMANQLEVSHSAISQMVGNLEQKGLLQIIKDKNDKRQKLVSFTEKGNVLLQEVSPVWNAISKAMKALLQEGESSKKLMIALNEVETSIERESIFERVNKNMLQKTKINLLSYSPEIAGKLQMAIDVWRKTTQNISFIEIASCWEKKGEIVLAEIEDKIVGLIITEKEEGERTLINKIFIQESWRRKGIASKLIHPFLETLPQKKQIDVNIPQQDIDTIQLFKRNGFSENQLVNKQHTNNNITFTYGDL
jgi:DNA-binding MarR family transcriptional regulator/GNAT superfamily N-acetyltransferase